MSIAIPGFCVAQKQGNIWYFGDHAGLNFNSGNPVAITDGQTGLYPNPGSHSEGCSVISDSAGNFLFYSNGEKAWNKNHQIMLNGDSLLGHSSSTQSALIVPQPQSSRYFYLFTTDAFIYNNLKNGLRYSVVDMCLDNGKGAIVNNKKNILLLDTVSEKLTATKHTNGIDYWIVTHKYFSNAFYSYLLTANGITDTIISHIGSAHQNVFFPGNTNAAIGQMKISPNGTKIALCFSNTNPAVSELFNFNNSTGVVSNFISLPTDSIGMNLYGVEFSPDNSKLYFSYNEYSRIYQYDLNAGGGNANSIKSSKTLISNSSNQSDYVNGMQLGTDGKIYVAKLQETFLATINNPNTQGLGCNFQDNAVSLNNKTCSYGLPNFINSYDYYNTVVDCETGINEAHNTKLNMRIYPNPSNTTFNITLPSPQIFTISITDITGRAVYTNKNATINIAVDASSFSSGVYLVKAVNENTVLMGKIVKE